MNKKRLLIIIGIVVGVVVVAVVLDTMLANHQPAITNLIAEPQRVLPGGSSQISCSAVDADGDELTYNWSASEGAIVAEGPTATWKAPLALGSYDISVTVSDDRSGEVTKTVTIEVRTNEPPVIDSLTAGELWTLPSGSLNVTCIASDPDSDELNYEWITGGGDITRTGPIVTWTAPEETGVYNITVVVTDGYGGSDTRTQPISVVTGQAPMIESLLVTADHCYLKTYSWGYKVGREQEYHIECIAYHADGLHLSYQWESDEGEFSEISEDGSMATWVAPDEYVSELTITVTVSDSTGNVVMKSVTLQVVSCSSCTFGC